MFSMASVKELVLVNKKIENQIREALIQFAASEIKINNECSVIIDALLQAI